ncbi:MAG: hypothetical protein WKF47_12670 [Geodermatophilaceae bacterium]
MRMLTAQRTQLLLDEDRAPALVRATATSRSVGSGHGREANDRAPGRRLMTRAQPAEYLATAPLMDIGTPTRSRRELRDRST